MNLRPLPPEDSALPMNKTCDFTNLAKTQGYYCIKDMDYGSTKTKKGIQRKIFGLILDLKTQPHRKKTPDICNIYRGVGDNHLNLWLSHQINKSPLLELRLSLLARANNK